MITTFRVLGGLMSGGGLLMTYRSLRSVEQGKTVFIAYKQSTILFDLALSTFSLLKDMELYNLKPGRKFLLARLIAYPLPFALQILHYNLDEGQLKAAVDNARGHVEKVAFAIDVTVSLLFTYYVAPYYGVGMLAGLTIELMNEEKILPAKVKDVWEKAWIGLAFSRLFRLAIFNDNDLWELGLFACELTVFTYEHYFADSFETKRPSTSVTSPSLMNKNIPVSWPPLLENPNLVIKGASNLDIQTTMDTLIEKVEWNKKNLKSFKLRLLQDPIFLETFAGGEISDETAKTAFAAGARHLAYSVACSTIKKGDSYIRYEVMQGMLRSILKTMVEDFSLSAVDDLFQLAISGGDYCGGGIAETIDNVYKRRVIEGKEVPLRVKFLHLLAAMRKRWFDHLYGRVTQITYKWPKGIFDPADVHFYNISLFYFDKSLKLHSEAIKNDMNITETSFCSRFYRLLMSTALDYTFWIYALKSPEWHSPEAIIEEIGKLSGLKLEEFTIWWKQWIERQTELSPVQKEQMQDTLLQQGKIFNESIGIQQKKEWVVNPKLLKLMLCDMGLLEVPHKIKQS